MDDTRLRLLTMLSLACCLAFTPFMVHADDLTIEAVQVSEMISDGRYNPSITDPDQISTAVTSVIERAGWELVEIPRSKQLRGTDTTLGSYEEKTGFQSTETNQTNEFAEGATSSSSFSIEEEALLLSVAAADSRRNSPEHLLGVFIGLARKRAGGKADPEGVLSSAYESGGDNAAIGYDTKGGTSYGLYQIASNSGTMDQFLRYLATKAPDLYKRLAEAGPANTGSKSGGKPDAWKRISAEQDKRFAALQHDFIRESHFEPAARSISTTCGLVVSDKPQAMQEVLWSTTVHHGVQRATKIFVTAADNLQVNDSTTQNFDLRMIEEVYRLRSNLLGEHGVQATAIRKRLLSEKEYAVTMLHNEK